MPQNYNKYIVILSLCVIILHCQIQTIAWKFCLIQIASDGSLESPDPIPPEGGVWTCPVTLAAGAGLGVNITLKQLNLDASLGDYLTINAGEKT